MRFEAEIAIAAATIGQLSERVTDFLSERGVDGRAAHHVALVVEEMLTNLATHGGSADQSAVVRIAIEPAHVQGEIIDTGPPFDPRTSADPDVTADLADRPIG